MVCHEGARKGAADQATKLPDWTGAGSTHIDGPLSARSRNYARMLDVSQRKAMILQNTCTGCHEIHAKDDAARLRTTAFDERGQLLPVKRSTVAQVCFGCHAGTEAARLLHGDSDIGALFVKGAGSSHQPGLRASDTSGFPSLRLGLFQGTLDCTSCHANPNPAGPKGPHTSPFPFLLRAAYGREADLAVTGDRSNELCYSCHDKNSIQGNQSFPLHAQHIQGFTGSAGAQYRRPDAFMGLPIFARPRSGQTPAGFGRPTACATCHDPHGSPTSPSLIRFDPAVVSRSSYGLVEFQRTGLGHGSCTLSCHGYDHVQSRY
ncbi:MAG TPA: cytochrome c3 family protein [Holophagaceae bacterium]|nr:cytochrome c3 family protein [Holophagaceae bacterium]